MDLIWSWMVSSRSSETMNSYLYQYVVKQLDHNLLSEIEKITFNHTEYKQSKVENFDGNQFDPNSQDLTRNPKFVLLTMSNFMI